MAAFGRLFYFLEVGMAEVMGFVIVGVVAISPLLTLWFVEV